MNIALYEYPGATPQNIPAQQITPAGSWAVTVDNCKREGTRLTIAAPLLWSGTTPKPNIIALQDGALSLYYFIDRWLWLSREEFRCEAEYSATMTALYNNIPCDIVCSRFSEPDTDRPSITNEPLLDPIAPYFAGEAYSTHPIDNQDDVGVVVTMATDIYGRVIKPDYTVNFPLSDRVQQPVSFLLEPNLSTKPGAFDSAIETLEQLVKEAGTNANVIQRIQIVPKEWLETLSNPVDLNAPEGGIYVAIRGYPVVPTTQKVIYTRTQEGTDYAKALYYNSELVIRNYGANVGSIPVAPGKLQLTVGYSLVNGVNLFLRAIAVGAGTANQIPLTVPEIVSVGDYYTAWYEANKEQILTQGATAALAVTGSIALAIASVASGGSLLAPALAVGGSLISGVSTGVSINRQMQEAKRGQQVVGTTATAAYTNSKIIDLLEVYYPTVNTTERRAVCARYGYASTRVLSRIPPESDSPRRLWCSLSGSLTSSGWVVNSTISRTEHTGALSAELADGVVIWYGGTVGDFTQTNYTK